MRSRPSTGRFIEARSATAGVYRPLARQLRWLSHPRRRGRAVRHTAGHPERQGHVPAARWISIRLVDDCRDPIPASPAPAAPSERSVSQRSCARCLTLA